jgi:two-component system response regulator
MRRPRTVTGSGSSSRAALAHPATILLVDADEEARAMMRDALLEGARPSALRAVATVDDLAGYLEGADAVTTPRPSLVLIDLELPGGQGLAAVRTVKADPAHGRIPVIALTRRHEPSVVDDAYAAGANTVLPRPVTFLALVRLMKVFTAYWLEAAALPRQTA